MHISDIAHMGYIKHQKHLKFHENTETVSARPTRIDSGPSRGLWPMRELPSQENRESDTGSYGSHLNHAVDIVELLSERWYVLGRSIGSDASQNPARSRS